MAILNDPASLPSPMWAWCGFSLSTGGQYPAERARALLSPPSLLPDERGQRTRPSMGRPHSPDLGLVMADDDRLSLAPPARGTGARRSRGLLRPSFAGRF